MKTSATVLEPQRTQEDFLPLVEEERVRRGKDSEEDREIEISF